MQQLELGDLDLGETNFVLKKMTRATPTKSENMETSGGDFLLILEVQHLNMRNRENHQTRKRNKWSMQNPFSMN